MSDRRVTEAAVTGPRYSPEQVRAVLRRVSLVPDSMRTFSQTVLDASRVHRISATLLAQLLDLGLPHRGTGDGMLFDEYDLSNVGVALGLPCARRMAMRWWSKALASAVPGARSRYTIEATAPCPSPGHAGPCPFTVHARLAEAVRPGSLRFPGPRQATFEVELTCRTHYFGERFAPLVERAAAMQFHLLPVDHPAAADLGFLAETGLADCRLATLSLIRLSRELGLPARPAIGYLVAPPYPQAHGWLEFEDEGRFWPADPFLLHALARWGIVDPDRWPPNRSPDGLLWRLSDRGFLEFEHGDTPVRANLAIVGRTGLPAAAGTGSRTDAVS